MSLAWWAIVIDVVTLGIVGWTFWLNRKTRRLLAETKASLERTRAMLTMPTKPIHTSDVARFSDPEDYPEATPERPA